MTGKVQNDLHILLVDDEEFITFTLTAFLEDHGYKVLVANNGKKALEILNNQPVEIAIVDIRLREDDGNKLILTAHEVQPGLKFLIHTGSVTYTIPDEMAALGISEDDIFVKPIRNFNTLFEAIERKAGERTADALGQTGKIFIRIDPVLKAFVPEFRKIMERYIVSIAEYLDQGDFAKIREIAHRLKGEAGTYGFNDAGKLGGMIQLAAESQKAVDIKRLLSKLSDYLTQVEIADGE